MKLCVDQVEQGLFAWQQEQEGEEQGGKSIIPDITTCGKAITSGYCPLSCVFSIKNS